MKLNSRYDPRSHTIPDNDIYTRLRSTFEKLFWPPRVVTDGNLKYEASRFAYQLSPVEREFYGSLYLRNSPALSQPNSFATWFDAETLSRLDLGVNEEQILTALTNDAKLNHYVLGPVGAGKSTLLRYFFLYLLPHSPALSKRFWPILVRLDTGVDLPDGPEQELFSTKFKKCLEPAISLAVDASHGLGGIENEDLWGYLETLTPFYALRRQTDALIAKHRGDKLAAWKEIADLRIKFQEHPDYYLGVLSFFATKSEVRPVLIVDNVDQFPVSTCSKLVVELFSIREKFQISTICAMRTHNFDLARKEYLSDSVYPNPVRMMPPNVVDYTRKKAKKLQNMTNEKIMVDTKNGVHWELEVALLINVMIDILLHERCIEFVANAAQFDLRRWNRIAELYLSSGLLSRSQKHVEALLHYYARGEKALQSTPQWIPIVSSINRNHATFFDPNRIGEDRHLIPNVYCNGESNPVSHFVRMQMLAYCGRRPNGVLATEVARDYQSLFFASNPEQSSNTVRKALRHLIDGRFIDSDSVYFPTSQHSLDHFGTITVTEFGLAWLEKWIGSYEVVVYMKDDVWFYEGIPAGVKDCIEGAFSVRHRLDSAVKFIRYLFEREQALLAGLGSAGLRHVYIKSFSHSEKAPLFSLRIAIELKDFCESRSQEVEADIAAQTKDLLKLVHEATNYQRQMLIDVDSVEVRPR